MARLTDTQLIILSAASQRDDRGVELPANLKGEAARKVVDKPIRAGLLAETRASWSLPVWRRDDESGSMALCITKNGLAAIDVEDEATAAPKDTSISHDRSVNCCGCPNLHTGFGVAGRCGLQLRRSNTLAPTIHACCPTHSYG
jgi:hypothetical protein